MKMRTKITLWFSAVIILVSALSFAVILTISKSAIYTNVKDILKEIVTENTEEVEFKKSLDGETVEYGDHYLEYDGGFLEIDDDYLSTSRGVYSSLYNEKGELLYGEDLIGASINEKEEVLEVKNGRKKYYVYNVNLKGENLERLTLQGVIDEDANKSVLTSIVSLSLIFLPLLDLISIVSCYILSGRLVRPIKSLTEATEEIGDGDDLSKRLELPKSRDETYYLSVTFNQMLARLEKAFSEEKQFTADISHELRTPVATILAQTELALEKERTAEEYQSSLEVVHRQGSKMKTIVEKMLQISRLERLEKLQHEEKVNLSLLLEEICFERRLVGEKNIALTDKIKEDLFVSGDESLLEILANNLLSNAFRYTAEGGKVDVSLFESGDKAVLEIADNGIGIEKENLEKIFDKFFQEDRSRTNRDIKYTSGLGLSAVKTIAKLHGAKIEVQSEVGVGSKFKIIFKKF